MKLRHNNRNTYKSVLGIYAFPAIRTFRLKHKKAQKTTLTPVDSLGVWMAMKGESVDGDDDDGDGDIMEFHYGITCGMN